MTKKQALRLINGYLDDMYKVPRTIFDVYANPSHAKCQAYDNCIVRYEQFIHTVERTSVHGIMYERLGIKSYNTFIFSAWGLVQSMDVEGCYYLVIFYPSHSTVITFGITAYGAVIDSIEPLSNFGC